MTPPPPAGAAPFWRGLTAPKSDAAPADNEDAFAAAPRRGAFAVADGATHSGFAGHWARLLVEGFVAAGGWRPDWVAAQRRAWAAAVDHLDVPWFVAERREEGAFASLLGVSLAAPVPGGGGEWAAVAIGDACLFHLRAGRVLVAWSVGHSAGFGNAPRLIGSRVPADEPALEVLQGEWRPGDHLLLATDALACWFLTQHEADGAPWSRLRELIDAPHADHRFGAAVGRLRAAKQLKDDDTTLLAIRL